MQRDSVCGNPFLKRATNGCQKGKKKKGTKKKDQSKQGPRQGIGPDALLTWRVHLKKRKKKGRKGKKDSWGRTLVRWNKIQPRWNYNKKRPDGEKLLQQKGKWDG